MRGLHENDVCFKKTNLPNAACFAILLLWCINALKMPVTIDLEPGDVITGQFQVTRTLGAGAFGAVFEARDLTTGGMVAVKLEPLDAKHPQLGYEYRVMTELAMCPGIPRCIWYGWDDEHNILVMQRLNTSLEQLRVQQASNTLPLEYVGGLCRQALERLNTFHDAGFVHRDVKPENLMLSHGILYLIDFGLCKRVVDPEAGVHIAHRTGKNLTGSPRYASIRAHRGHEQSRRDDLEALMYTMIFLVRGRLPWQHDGSVSLTVDEIGEEKARLYPEQLCDGLPTAFRRTLTYARNLQFEALPNYEYLLSLWAAV